MSQFISNLICDDPCKLSHRLDFSSSPGLDDIGARNAGTAGYEQRQRTRRAAVPVREEQVVGRQHVGVRMRLLALSPAPLPRCGRGERTSRHWIDRRVFSPSPARRERGQGRRQKTVPYPTTPEQKTPGLAARGFFVGRWRLTASRNPRSTPSGRRSRLPPGRGCRSRSPGTAC